MKKKLISPNVIFLENDKSELESNNTKKSLTGKRSGGSGSGSGSGGSGGSGINLDDFILVEYNSYLLQEDGSKLKI